MENEIWGKGLRMGREGGFEIGGFGRGDVATAMEVEREEERPPFTVAYAREPTLQQQRIAGNSKL